MNHAALCTPTPRVLNRRTALAATALLMPTLGAAQAAMADAVVELPSIANLNQFKALLAGRDVVLTDEIQWTAPTVAPPSTFSLSVNYQAVPYPSHVAVFQRDPPGSSSPAAARFSGNEATVWAMRFQPRMVASVAFSMQLLRSTRLLVVVAGAEGVLYGSEHEIKIGRATRPS